MNKFYEKKLALKRFWSQIKKDDETGCWNWTGYCSCAGTRPVITAYRKQVKAHRYSYSEFKGPIPKGHYICHHCDNRFCVNPDHLFAGTQDDNMKDMMKKDRQHNPKGELNGRAKLTEEDVLYIRKSYIPRHKKFSQKALAKKFRVTTTQIQAILYRQQWTHI